MKRVGIALGGGGARGVAHLAYLKALDDMGVSPVVISGTSSGSIGGALYTGGMKPDEILELLNSMFSGKKKTGILKRIASQSSTLVSMAARKMLGEIVPVKTFEQLNVPLKVVATNVNSLEERVFTSGSVLDAVMCSVALPGVILPQMYEGQYYIDGGATNIVPFDIIRDECDILIAIDVSQVRANTSKPNMETAKKAEWAATQEAFIKLKLKQCPVEIFERPSFEDIGTMEFSKMIGLYKRAEKLVPEFKRKLEKLL